MTKLDIAKVLGLDDMTSHLESVSQRLTEVISTDQPSLAEPLARINELGGKKLRSSLVIASALASGGKFDDKLRDVCVVIELIHMASLVHDDIIDGAETRRGQSTVVAREGLSSAILVGDYLLAKAHLLAADLGTEIAKVTAETFVKLCEGEAAEVGSRFNLERSEESYFYAITNKTGALVSAACKLGGLAAKADTQTLSALDNYGTNFGIAFQIIDDLLDLLSSEKLLGKPVGKDAQEGVYTLPVILALHEDDSDEMRRILGDKSVDNKVVLETLQKTNAIKLASEEAEKYTDQAQAALQGLDGFEALANLPKAYEQWSMQELVV